jgi:hypothetical protein
MHEYELPHDQPTAQSEKAAAAASTSTDYSIHTDGVISRDLTNETSVSQTDDSTKSESTTTINAVISCTAAFSPQNTAFDTTIDHIAHAIDNFIKLHPKSFASHTKRVTFAGRPEIRFYSPEEPITAIIN